MFSTLLNANNLVYKPNQVRDLILRNAQNDNIERIIYINDMLLIDVAGDLKHYAGNFLGIQDDFIFISKKNILDDSIVSIHIDEIDAIYLGIGKTFQQLRNTWGLGFSIAVLPGSIHMAYNSKGNEEIVPKPIAALVTWGMMSTVSYLFYGNIFGGVDYIIRKGRAQEFIIGHDGYFIN